jgi:hypothetical protein
MTECSQESFPFAMHFLRRVVAQFDGARMTTDGGGLLLRQTDRKIGLLNRVVACFRDGREPVRIKHGLGEMLRQRIYGVALGYEDLNDHEELRRDPLLAVLAGKREIEEPLAGKSTLNRLELTPQEGSAPHRYHKISYSAAALDALLVDIFLEAHRQAPAQIVLDLDATDMPLHGQQEGRFFHGYYGHYCYLPPVHFLWRSPAVCPAAALQSGRQRGQCRGTRAPGGPDSRPLEEPAHHRACRFRFLSRGTDGLVRRPSGGLCAGPGPQ